MAATRIEDIFQQANSKAGINLEEGLARLGMGHPIARACIGAVVGFVVVEALKPYPMYTADGVKAPWKATSPDEEDATSIPWFYAPVAGAVVGGLFM
jgi:hypothetical protein